MFMPPDSTVVEIIAVQQKGRVYQTLAKFLGHRYIVCPYNRTDPTYMSQIPSATGDSFVLNMPSFLQCLQKNLCGSKAPAVSPLGDAATSRLYNMNKMSLTVTHSSPVHKMGKASLSTGSLQSNMVVKAIPFRGKKKGNEK